MSISNDVTLMAYIDGELDADQRVQLETELAADETLRSRLKELQKVTAELGSTYDSMLSRPVPARLIQSILKNPSSSVETGRGLYRFSGALAAGVAVFALGLGFGGGYMTAGVQHQQALVQAQVNNQQIIAVLEKTLNRVLETERSGTSVRWQSEKKDLQLEITPLRTFKTKDNQYCREYKQVLVKEGVALTQQNLSCRIDRGRWKTLYRMEDGPRTRL